MFAAGTPCVSKDTIVSHIKQSGGTAQFTMMPPAGSGGGGGGGGGGGSGGDGIPLDQKARKAAFEKGMDGFYTSSSSSGSESDSD